MRTYYLVIGIVLSLFIATSSVDAAGIKHIFNANLSGSEEVPAVRTSGNGHIKVTIPADEAYVEYALDVRNLSNITAAHLHCAPRGANGPAVVTLYDRNGNTSTTTGLTAGKIYFSNLSEAGKTCGPNIDSLPHFIQALREGTIYVNVHTVAHPNGEIRGQLYATYDSTGYLKISNTTTPSGASTTASVHSSTAQLQLLIQQLMKLLASLR
jgi:hypothetical protein